MKINILVEDELKKYNEKLLILYEDFEVKLEFIHYNNLTSTRSIDLKKYFHGKMITS